MPAPTDSPWLSRRTSRDAPAAARATLGGIEGWGHVLKHEHCTLTLLLLDLWLPAQGGLVAICEAMLTNTTLETLIIGRRGYRGTASIEAMVNIEEADAEALAAMLRNNRTLTRLDMWNGGILWNAMVIEGLSCNSSLEELHISLDPDGAHALMTLLQLPGGPITTSTAIVASSTCPSQIKKLGLGTHEGGGFPTAISLRDMLASNRTLLELDLSYAPYFQGVGHNHPYFQEGVGHNHPPGTRQQPVPHKALSLSLPGSGW